MKKIINDPNSVVRESLEGLAMAHNDLLKVNVDPVFVYRVDAPIKDKVAIISGGGSGHEPLHTGFVGKGMLDAACPGEVFSSPTPDQMLAAAETVSGEKGVLFIVKNYSGDIMNFEMAIEMARSKGIKAFNIIIDDDVAVADSLYTQGRRGTGNTLFAEKICGAAAERRMPIEQLTNLCRKINTSGKSMGIALTSCTTPAKGSPIFDIGEDEIEVGVGIHGELGRTRTKLKTADEIAEILTLGVIEDKAYIRTLNEWDETKNGWIGREVISESLKSGDNVIALINGMGATPLSELYIIYREVAKICQKKGLKIVDKLIGSYITSLDMAGVSLTLLKVNEEIYELWKDPVKTPSLYNG